MQPRARGNTVGPDAPSGRGENETAVLIAYVSTVGGSAEVGTFLFPSYPRETHAGAVENTRSASESNDALVREMIKRIADRWTWLVIEALAEGELRFSQLRKEVGGVSQKMLTATLRQLERDGLVSRRVSPTIPPRVDYKLTALGSSLAAAFCGVWLWAEKHHRAVEAARVAFDKVQAREPAVTS